MQQTDTSSLPSGEDQRRLAVLIDADNAQPSVIEGLLAEVASDFTRLAQRLREAGKVVYGFGERKTPKPFVVACDKFIYTEVLRKDAPSVSEGVAIMRSPSVSAQDVPAMSAGDGVSGSCDAVTSNSPKPLESPVNLISQAIEQGADESGWAHLGFVGSYLTKIQPDFDPRLYGCRKLSDLLRKYSDAFETSERGSPGSPSKALYVRVVAQRNLAKPAG